MNSMRSQRGFSKVEIIVVIAISILVIGIAVGTGWYLSLKNKDIAILSDISRITSALDITYAVNTHYPIHEEGVDLSSQIKGTQQLCLRDFTEFAEECEQVVLSPLPRSIADTPPYWYISHNDGAEFSLEFFLDSNHESLGLIKGPNCAFPGGISAGRCLVE